MDSTIIDPAHKRDSSPLQSDISSTTDDVSYMEKYTHIKAIVVQQERDLQQLRIKHKAVETMQELFKESEAENSKLRKEKMDLEGAISILQSRLASYGHSTSKTFDENDVFLPGPDKDLIKELSKENAKLKQGLKFATVDPSCMDNLLQENKRLKEEKEHFESEYLKIKDEFQLFHKTLKSSTDEKSMRLLQLQQQVEELNKAKSTSELLCHSLSLESVSLKQKLQEMAGACQELVKRLERKELQKSNTSDNSLEAKHPSRLGAISSTDSSSQLNELRSENSKLQMELMAVSQKLKSAAETNQRWQKFSDQREEYVKTLTKENDEIKKKLNIKGIVGLKQSTPEDQLHAVNAKLIKVSEEKTMLEEQNRSLSTQLRNHKDIIARMKEQISIQSDTSVNEYTERINMLEHQVRICAEDFETERKDREKAQAQIALLQNELKSAQEQLRRYQVSDMNRMHYERLAALQKYKEDQRRLPEPHLVARGFATSGELDHYDGNITPPGKKVEKEDILQCPRCNKGFPSDRHNELLEHMDNCVD